MADNVRVEIDLTSGKLTLDCQESSLDSILSRLTEFLPKFREETQHSPRHAAQAQNGHRSDEPAPKSQIKAVDGLSDVPTKKRTPTAARSGAAPEARTEVQSYQLSVDEPGLLAWGSLGKDWKKFLWILEAARKNGIDGLTNGEITYLMNKTFREFRSPKVVNNLKKKIKDRHVQPSTVDVEGKTYSIWRILSDGSKEVVQPPSADKA